MGHRAPTFGELVGDEEEFLAEYFNRRPLFRPQAIVGDPREILSIADMDEIVHQEALRSTFFRVIKSGQPARESTYTAHLDLRRQSKEFNDCLVAERMYEYFRAGYTIVQNGMNHSRPNLRTLARMMAEKFAARSEVVAFLTPAGRQGFSAHCDPTDTYIIQLEGTKHWQVWETPEVRRAGDESQYSLAELPTPVLDVSLQPGDVLYLPFGTPHVTMAQDTVSLHLTVLAEPRMWSELLAPLVQRLVHEDPSFWGVPYLDGADRSPELAQILEQLVGRLRGLDLRKELAKLTAQGIRPSGTAQGSFFQDTAALDGINGQTPVRRAGKLVFHEPVDGRAVVGVGGNKIAMPVAVAAALRETSSTQAAPADSFLTNDDADQSLSAVRYLARMGALVVDS